MKKGDLRKQEILRTAEQMFCRKGYDQTSIQDTIILSVMMHCLKHCATRELNRAKTQ